MFTRFRNIYDFLFLLALGNDDIPFLDWVTTGNREVLKELFTIQHNILQTICNRSGRLVTEIFSVMRNRYTETYQ